MGEPRVWTKAYRSNRLDPPLSVLRPWQDSVPKKQSLREHCAKNRRGGLNGYYRRSVRFISENFISQFSKVFFAISKIPHAAFSPSPSVLEFITWIIRLIGFLIPAKNVLKVDEKNLPHSVHLWTTLLP